jgi:hypothetical protein
MLESLQLESSSIVRCPYISGPVKYETGEHFQASVSRTANYSISSNPVIFTDNDPGTAIKT